MDRDKLSSLYRGPPIDDTYQVSIYLVKRFQRRRFFRNQPIRNKNCLWRPCLLTDEDEMSNLYRGPSIDASYQVSIHLAKAKKTNMCIYCHMSKKSRVGRSGLIFFLLLLSAKPEIIVPGSGIRFRYFIFEISSKPSFIDCFMTNYAVCLPSLLSISTKS